MPAIQEERKILEKNKKLKQAYINLANSLLKDGFKKHEISTVGAEELRKQRPDCSIHYWRKICSELGYTNSSYAHNTN